MRIYADRFSVGLKKYPEYCWYFLGLWLADGSWQVRSAKNITLTISLHQDDIKVLRLLASKLFGSKRVYISHGMAVLQVSSVACAKWVSSKLGILPGTPKTRRCMIPTNKPDLFCTWLRGLIDGDGTFIHRKNGYGYFELASTDLYFLSALGKRLKSMGVETRLNKPDRNHRLGCKVHVPEGRTSIVTHEVWGLATSRHVSACRLYELLYMRSSIHLERKYLKVKLYYTNTVPNIVSKTLLTDKQFRDAHARYKKGESTAEIAESLGKTPSSLTSGFKRRNLVVRQSNDYKLDSIERAKLIADYGINNDARSLARQYEVSYASVLNYVKKAGIFRDRRQCGVTHSG